MDNVMAQNSTAALQPASTLQSRIHRTVSVLVRSRYGSVVCDFQVHVVTGLAIVVNL